MADRFTPDERSRIMARIKDRNTKPELFVRRLLHRMGYRFRLHRKDLPGKPDIVLPRHRKIIFVHGCYWHGHPGCKRSARPSSNEKFWNNKLESNIERDLRNQAELRASGWAVLVIWECETRSTESLYIRLTEFIAK